MQREIKFRAWDKRQNEMYGHYDIRGFVLEGIKNNDDYVFMQFTGLKDKDGTEVYEGDILSSNGKDPHSVVEWDEKRTGYFVGTFNLDNFEIIGDIYTTPELLNN